MVKDRGYPDARITSAPDRPSSTPAQERSLCFPTLPGWYQMVDLGHFGHPEIGRARRPLMALSQCFLVAADLPQLLSWRSHGEFLVWPCVAAELGGVPRIALYDNLKSAVLERQGTVIRFNPTLLALLHHYRFEPRPVAVARGNEKGRVERAIRYIRDAFFAGRSFTDLADLNAQADALVVAQAGERRCPEDDAHSQ